MGGGIANYLKNPYLWSWLNFDGEHYLALVRYGYQPLTYFFFPLYPLTISFFASIFGKTNLSLSLVGLAVSNISFLIGLVGFWKLILVDNNKTIAKIAILILLIFPTSFYFGSYYTESLFFALSVWAFYFVRKTNWIAAGLLGGLAALTRLVGIVLLFSFVIEIIQQKIAGKKFNTLLAFLAPALVCLGLITYVLYLNKVTGDPLEFLHSVTIFGAQRSSKFILLPQVFYRYIFKILPNLSYSYLPVVYTTYLEFIVGLAFLVVSLVGFIKLRLSYAAYLFFGYLIPTLSGSFSSLPRYVIVLFPAFILVATSIEKDSRLSKAVLFTILFILLGIATALFARGYWVS